MAKRRAFSVYFERSWRFWLKRRKHQARKWLNVRAAMHKEITRVAEVREGREGIADNMPHRLAGAARPRSQVAV